MPWGFEEQQRTVLVQVFCTEAWAEKKGYYMEISLILNDLTIDYSQSRTHDNFGCSTHRQDLPKIHRRLSCVDKGLLWDHQEADGSLGQCCLLFCLLFWWDNFATQQIKSTATSWQQKLRIFRSSPFIFFWLHVPHFCLLGRKKDCKSDDFLFLFNNIWLEQKTSRNVPTVTYSNLEFFFLHVMTWVVSGIPGRKVSFGSMLFYESDFLDAQPEWTWQYKIHASSRLSCKSVKRVPSVFVGKIITDRHRFGLHEDDHFQYPPKV